MAKLTAFVEHQPDFFQFGDMGQVQLADHGGKSATFTEIGSGADGDMLVVRGSDFYYSGGVLVKGTITGMTLFNADGERLYSMSDANLNAASLPAYGFYWPTAVAAKMLVKNDTLTGSSINDNLQGKTGNDKLIGFAGDDYLVGGKGKDILTGGFGADTFSIMSGDGDDKITDFNSKGDDFAMHDKIQTDADQYEVFQRGRHTVIEFDNDTTVTLMNFSKAQLDAGDILVI